MPSQRNARATPDAPITGVAEGSLGTGANLDDTQVMRTEDLRAAAAAAVSAAPTRLDGPAESTAATSDAPPVEPAAAPIRTAAVAASPPAPRRTSARVSGRTVPAIAGVVALVVLLLIAGSGLFSQLDFGSAAGPVVSFGAATEIPAPATPAPKPLSGKGGGGDGVGHGPKGCHGHGHGSGC